MKYLVVAFALVTTMHAGAPPEEDPPRSHDLLASVLWVQTAEEYEGVCRSVWSAARAAFDRSLEIPHWSASLEQMESGGYGKKPPAVVVDVDETVLDNSPYQAWLVENKKSFSSDTWAQWVRSSKAGVVPGSLEFLEYVTRRGATVFYVTNRAANLEEATRDNLRKHGFPIASDVDVVLTMDEKKGWGSIKTSRRKHIASTHRIVVMVGDDLGDFMLGDKYDRKQRVFSIARRPNWWGVRWFCLPNPSYGSWLSTVLKGQKGQAQALELKLKRDALKPAGI